ncbi:MAG: hypothetical protein AAB397_03205 [Patescibacteria group bacterium]
MGENIKEQFEKVEHIPTLEEVFGILEQMTGGKYKEIKRYIDKQGNLYRLDAVAPGTKEGETIEFFYNRKGRYSNGDCAAETEIHSVYIDRSSYGPAGPQASFINGKWKIIN